MEVWGVFGVGSAILAIWTFIGVSMSALKELRNDREVELLRRLNRANKEHEKRLAELNKWPHHTVSPGEAIVKISPKSEPETRVESDRHGLPHLPKE